MVFETNAGSRRSTRSGGLMKAKFIALSAPLWHWADALGIKYPNYYTLNLPSPPSASQVGGANFRDGCGPRVSRTRRICDRSELYTVRNPNRYPSTINSTGLKIRGRTVTAAITRKLTATVQVS